MEVVEVPPGVRFSLIHRELQTQGKVYVIERVRDIPWVSQRMPHLVRALCASGPIPVRTPSCYRLIRGEMRRKWTADLTSLRLLQRDELEALNALVARTGCRVVTACTDCWEVERKGDDAPAGPLLGDGECPPGLPEPGVGDGEHRPQPVGPL